MDIKTHTLVVIHLAGIWETFHRRHLILSLADALPDGWAILCVNRPLTFDVTLLKDPRRFIYGLRHRHPRQISTRLLLYTPWQISHEIIAGRLPFLPKVNRRLVHRQLRRIISDRFPDAEKLISWIYHPVQSWVQGLVPDEITIYECYDENSMSACGSLLPDTWQAEQKLLARTDLTFFTAELLAKRRAPFTRRSCNLPNGVPAFFTDFADDQPVRRPNRTGTLIGYLGNFYSFMAIDILLHLCRDHPEWDFTFAGPTRTKSTIAGLEALPNVSFPGPIPYADVPAFLRKLDIALIAFDLNDYVLATNPLKTYEYMASGVPIVASDLPELRQFNNVIRIVDNTPEAFAKAIADTLAADRTSLSKKLVETARKYTWDAICHDVVVPALRNMSSGKNRYAQNLPVD